MHYTFYNFRCSIAIQNPIIFESTIRHNFIYYFFMEFMVLFLLVQSIVTVRKKNTIVLGCMSTHNLPHSSPKYDYGATSVKGTSSNGRRNKMSLIHCIFCSMLLLHCHPLLPPCPRNLPTPQFCYLLPPVFFFSERICLLLGRQCDSCHGNTYRHSWEAGKMLG